MILLITKIKLKDISLKKVMAEPEIKLLEVINVKTWMTFPQKIKD